MWRQGGPRKATSGLASPASSVHATCTAAPAGAELAPGRPGALRLLFTPAWSGGGGGGEPSPFLPHLPAPGSHPDSQPSACCVMLGPPAPERALVRRNTSSLNLNSM